MTDIVERLRDGFTINMTFGTPDVKEVAILNDPMTPTDAIKEIDRLRAALTLIRDGYYNEMSAAIAGAALEGKE
jgi:hypothetical protein